MFDPLRGGSFCKFENHFNHILQGVRKCVSLDKLYLTEFVIIPTLKYRCIKVKMADKITPIGPPDL